MKVFKKAIYVLLAVSLVNSSVFAGIGGPVSPNASGLTDREINISRIERAAAVRAVSSRLAEIGIDEREFKRTLSDMSDKELQNLADKIDETESGGDALIVVVIVLIIVYMVIYASQEMVLHRD